MQDTAQQLPPGEASLAHVAAEPVRGTAGEDADLVAQADEAQKGIQISSDAETSTSSEGSDGQESRKRKRSAPGKKKEKPKKQKRKRRAQPVRTIVCRRVFRQPRKSNTVV